ncbi:hypothetical protein NESM_000510600 [Novymonas esmeraldas]|uniref:Uncharacterized protein n=1 Tax=Novymonas esmeraldas TaxID=1808958 RepID=A0AAW0EQ65_9TRYP
MPIAEVTSVSHFSAWLDEAILAEVPLGLSRRLRALVASTPAAMHGGALLLVRPHVGHVLASLSANSEEAMATLARSSGCSGGGGGTDAADRTCPPPTDATPVTHFYATLLTSWLRVTCDGAWTTTHRTSGPAAVDGVGRKVALYAAVLSHCVKWWDGGPALRQPISYVGAMAAAAAQTSSTALSESGGDGARRRVLRALRLLATPGGCSLRVRRWAPGAAESGVVAAAAAPAAGVSSSSSLPLLADAAAVAEEMDWLDFLVWRCVEVDLRSAGGYCSLGERVCIDDVAASSSAPAPPDVADLLSAALWHVLATEVEGDVLATLHGLLAAYLDLPCHVSAPRRDATPAACQSHDSPTLLRYVRHALHTLVHTPERVVACDVMHSPSHASASASSTPPVDACGPTEQSCVLQGSVCLVSVAHAASSSRFCLHGMPTSVAPDGAVRGRSPLRLLLLRVDPEGEWLPPPEALASQRTFHASFDAERGGTGGAGVGDDSVAWEADGTGKRAVLLASPAPSSLPAQALADCSPADDRVLRRIVAEVLRHGVLAEVVAASRGVDRHVWCAAVRLHLYALLHDVRVVITPERLPPLLTVFGYRHVPQLHQRLCEVRRAWGNVPAAQPVDSTDSADAAAALALLDAVCQRPPPLAVYVVDQVSLPGFAEFQGRCAAAAATDPLLPVTLCRDGLRHPRCFDEVRRAAAPSGVASSVHCGVVDVAELCHASVPGLPHHIWCSAAEVVSRCAAAVASVGSSDSSRPRGGGRVLVVVLFSGAATGGGVHPMVQAAARVDVGAEDGTGAATALPPLLLPTLLLLAPTALQRAHYAGLLRKAAAALLEALPRAHPLGEGGGGGSIAGGGHGLVRGGGAALVSLARQARWLLERLAAAPPREEEEAAEGRFSTCARVPVVCWGAGTAPGDRAAVQLVLAMLCEACAAVVTRLAQPLIAGCGLAEGRALLSQPTRVPPPPGLRGPRARRRLWREALRDSVEAAARAPPTSPQPVLHVFHKSVDALLAEGVHVTAADSGSDADTPGALAMQYFAADRRSPTTGSRSDGGAARLTPTPAMAPPPLLEPLHTNTRIVREALALVLRTLSASTGASTPSLGLRR